MNLNNKSVEVFKTDVQDKFRACELLQILLDKYPAHKINFDLSDRDNILRVESHVGQIDTAGVIKLLRIAGHFAEVLKD